MKSQILLDVGSLSVHPAVLHLLHDLVLPSFRPYYRTFNKKDDQYLHMTSNYGMFMV